MSNENPTTDQGSTITVDVLVPEAVLNAAGARLKIVQRKERDQNGVSTTSLADLGRRIITEWRPHKTPAPSKQEHKATCPTCDRQITVNANGKLRAHGPTGNRCAGLGVGSKLKPFRFPMNRERYNTGRDYIRESGQSVASVLSHSLVHFARTGDI